MAKDKEYEEMYKKERLFRTAMRKAKRKLKDSRLCKCGRNMRTKEAHSCPYAEDIHGDYSKNCYCCGDCERECAMDI